MHYVTNDTSWRSNQRLKATNFSIKSSLLYNFFRSIKSSIKADNITSSLQLRLTVFLFIIYCTVEQSLEKSFTFYKLNGIQNLIKSHEFWSKDDFYRINTYEAMVSWNLDQNWPKITFLLLHCDNNRSFFSLFIATYKKMRQRLLNNNNDEYEYTVVYERERCCLRFIAFLYENQRKYNQ